MTVDQVLAILRSAGFRHVVTLDGDQNDQGLKLGARGDFRLWHPLLCKPGSGKPGSVYVGLDRGQLDLAATGPLAECFEKTLGVPPTSGLPAGPGKGPRWQGSDLDALLGLIARLRN